MDCRTGKTLNPHTCVYVKDCKPGYMRNNKFQCRKDAQAKSNATNKVKRKVISKAKSKAKSKVLRRNTISKVISNATNKVISNASRRKSISKPKYAEPQEKVKNFKQRDKQN